MHGQFIWYELTTPDAESSIKFYPKFTGWGTQPFDKDYTMWTTGGTPFGGISKLTDEMRQQGVPPNWMAYIEADDVDVTVKKAEAIGGKVVVPPGDIPNAGRFAILQDPQGAMFGVYKSLNGMSGWDGTPVVGRFSWHELMAADHKAAFEFYGPLFDWEPMGEMDMGGGMLYFMFGRGGKAYGGMFTRMGDMATMHPFWLMYVHVKDVAAAVKTATKAGATVHREQMEIPGGSIAVLGDPQGAGFAVHHENPPEAPILSAAKKPTAATRVKKAAKKLAKKVAKTAAKVRKAATKAVKKVAKKKAAKKPAAKKSAAKKPAAKKSIRKAVKKAVKKATSKVTARKSARKSAARKR